MSTATEPAKRQRGAKCKSSNALQLECKVVCRAPEAGESKNNKEGVENSDTDTKDASSKDSIDALVETVIGHCIRGGDAAAQDNVYAACNKLLRMTRRTSNHAKAEAEAEAEAKAEAEAEADSESAKLVKAMIMVLQCAATTDLLEVACAVVSNVLLTANRACRWTFVMAYGVEAATGVITNACGKPGAGVVALLTTACQLLDIVFSRSLKFGRMDRMVAKVEAAQVVKAIVQLVCSYTPNNGPADLLSIACCVLCNLAHDDRNEAECGAVGGVEAVLQLVDARLLLNDSSSSNTKLLELACWTLSNITVDDGNACRCGRAGGVELMVAVVLRFNNARLLIGACGALRNMCVNDENAVKCSDAFGAKALAQVIGQHCSAGPTELLENACGALQSVLLFRPAFLGRDAAKDTGVESAVAAIKAAVSVLEQHVVTGPAALLARACGVLRNVTLFGSTKNTKAECGKVRGVEAVADVMRRFACSQKEEASDVLDEACGALHSICFNNNDNAATFGNAGGVKTLLDVVWFCIHDNFSKDGWRSKLNRPLLRHACLLLQSVTCSNVHNATRCGSDGAIGVLVDVLRRVGDLDVAPEQEDSDFVKALTCQTLSAAMLAHSESKSRFGEAGGVDVIVANVIQRCIVSSSGSTGLLNLAVGALRTATHEHKQNQQAFYAAYAAATLAIVNHYQNGPAAAMMQACSTMCDIFRNVGCVSTR
jgi:hypothetical protein